MFKSTVLIFGLLTICFNTNLYAEEIAQYKEPKIEAAKSIQELVASQKASQAVAEDKQILIDLMTQNFRASEPAAYEIKPIFNSDGKRVREDILDRKTDALLSSKSFDPATGQTLFKVYYVPGTQQVNRMIKYNRLGERAIRTEFDNQGRLSRMIEYDGRTQRLKSRAFYDPGSLAVYRFQQFNPSGHVMRSIYISLETSRITSVIPS